MKRGEDLYFVQWKATRKKRLEQEAQESRECYNKMRTEIQLEYGEVYLRMKEEALAEKKIIISVHELLNELQGYKAFLHFCQTNSGAFTLLENEIKENTTSTLVRAIHEEIVLERDTVITILILDSKRFRERDTTENDIESDSISAALRMEIHTEKAQPAFGENDLVELDAEGIQPAFKEFDLAELDMKIYNLKRKNSDESGEIVKKPKLQECELLEESESELCQSSEKSESEESYHT